MTIELGAPRRWIVLPIESNVRELHARTLLAATAAERGFGAVIGRQSELPHYVGALPQAVILQMNVISTGVMDLAHRYGHAVTALDEEGLVQRDPDDYLRRRISVPALEKCERFFAWGDVHRSAILSKAPQLAQRVVAVGSSRIDLLRPDIRNIYKSSAEQLTQRYGRFVLIASNLGTYNHRLGQNHVLRQWEASGWSNQAGGSELLKRTLEFQHNLFDEFVALLKALTKALPSDVQIVVRPHPAERLESWNDRIGHLRAVRVVHEGGVVPWLLAAQALVHNSCTTGIEAAILGRPTFAYLPDRDEAVECSLPNDVSRKIENVEELIASILDVLEEGGRLPSSPPPYPEDLKSHIEHLEGKLSSEAIIDHLDEIAPPASPLRKARSIPFKIRFGRAVVGTRSFASSLRHHDYGRERNAARFVRATSPGISVCEISNTLKALQRATGRFENTSCVAIAPNLVVMGKLLPDPPDKMAGSVIERTSS